MHEYSALAVKVSKYLEESCKYDTIHSVKIVFSERGEPYLSLYAWDDIAQSEGSKYQGHRSILLGDGSDIEARMWKRLAEIPQKAERELYLLAAATAHVVELSKEATSEAAQRFGEAFAEQLKEMRTGLPGPVASRTPNDEIPF